MDSGTIQGGPPFISHPEPLAIGITSIVQEPSALRVIWSDNHISRFHYVWLRDNCACRWCGDHESGSRFQLLLDIPALISPTSVVLDSSVVTIRWNNDGHMSHFGVPWLLQHAYDQLSLEGRRRRKTYWDGTIKQLPVVDFVAAEQVQEERLRLFASVAQFGFVVVHNVGIEPECTTRLTDLLGYVRDTHFGKVSDLTLRADGRHIADYPVGILPHTDETYRPTPTGINIFHCISPCDKGGGWSTLVDGHRCAYLLRECDPRAFDLLCEHPVQHTRRIAGETIHSTHPAFLLDTNEEVAEVRLNERTMSTLCVPEPLMEAMYAALRQAFTLAYATENRLSFRLEAGSALVFDNLRVLHGRTAVTGRRLVRQTNVMRDEFFARLAALEEAQA